ncbi:Glycerol-3-phosphate phosphatase [Trichoplax sp. H2]|nr:Glycerol-3-phosphate phosphatase [Trichoplax sp. H2]|eukprot:RDD39834.1 Glycerol-3-phosphate phosphatase [Trichoplax sp. H2]
MTDSKGRLMQGEQTDEFLSGIDTFFFDCDGVIWLGNEAIAGAVETVNKLRAKGKRIFFVSNNSSKSVASYMKKFQRFGIEAYPDEIYGTAKVTAWYIKNKLNFTGKVYLLGSESMAEEFDALDISHTGTGPDPFHGNLDTCIGSVSLDDDIGAVVQGLDIHVNYMKMIKATSYLAKESCLLIVTNEDDRLPVRGSNIVIPGTGSIGAILRVASRRQDRILIGKPNRNIYDCILSKHSINPESSCMIGDRIDTDIAFGIKCGFKTILVYSGVSTADEVEALRKKSPEMLPDYCLPTLADLMRIP